MKHTYESCAATAAKYTNKRDFRSGSNPQFQWLRRNSLLEQACAHMAPLYRSFTDEYLAKIASSFTHRRAFRDGDQSAFNAAKDRGIIDVICAHMERRKRVLSNDQVAEIALGFTSRSDFSAGDNGAYQSAIKRGILDEVCAHMDGKGTRRLSDAEILQIASKYRTRNDFKLGDFGAYTTALRRGLITDACDHMEPGANGFREDKPAVLYQFRIALPCGLVLYKAGITNRNPKQRLFTMGVTPGYKAELTGFISFDSGRDARIAEKRLHRKNSSRRYGGPPVMRNGNTELFTASVLEL